jgi:amino-acid N-acetyltransferase
MGFEDIPETLRIMEPFVKKGIILERSTKEIEEKLGSYVVYDVDGTLHACAALLRHPDKQGEIASLAVDEVYVNLGIGKKMVSYLIDKAARSGLSRVFVLTTQSADWFSQLGFRQGKVSDLPAAKKESYNRKRNSRILVYTVPRTRRNPAYRVE